MTPELRAFLDEYPDFKICDGGDKVQFTITGKKFAKENINVLRSYVNGKAYHNKKTQGPHCSEQPNCGERTDVEADIGSDLSFFLTEHPDFKLCDERKSVVFVPTGKKFDKHNVAVCAIFCEWENISS